MWIFFNSTMPKLLFFEFWTILFQVQFVNKLILILAWWELKNTQFQEVIFVTTIFEHCCVFSPSPNKHSRACHFWKLIMGVYNWFPNYNKPYICSRTTCTFIRAFNTNRFTNFITTLITLWFKINTKFHHVIQTLSKLINLHMVNVVTNITFLHLFHNKRMLCIKGPLSNNNFWMFMLKAHVKLHAFT